MLDLNNPNHSMAWPLHLEPVGEGSFDKEPFEVWWQRHKDELAHLPQEVVEQWIYRHWSNSVASFIPTKNLSCIEEIWPATDFINNIGTVEGNDPMAPEHDYDVFKGKHCNWDPLPTARALDKGEWDYAPIVLETPDGFIDRKMDHIQKPYFLVEGHLRRRYLNALLHRGEKIKDQRVFILRG